MKPKNNNVDAIITMEKTAMLLFILFFMVSIISAAPKDSDLDGIPDTDDENPFDYDNDGMPDLWEKKNGLRYDVKDADRDPDKDGATNLEEYLAKTNPIVSENKKPEAEESLEGTIFSPFEASLAKILLWSGAAFIFFLVVGILVFKVHIFNILKGLMHIGKTHAKQPQQYRTPTLPVLPPKRGYQRPASPYSFPYTRQKPKVLAQPRPQMPAYRAQQAPPQQQPIKQEQPIARQQPIAEEYIPIEQLQNNPMDRLKNDYIKEEDKLKEDDVFSKLNDYTSNYKTGQTSLKKIKAIR